jgi:putative transposase
LPRTYIDNLDFLADYFVSQTTIPEMIVSLIQERVQASPGITIAALLGGSGGLRSNDVYALIVQDQIFVDLNASSLRDHYRTHLYPDRNTALAYAQLGTASSHFREKTAEAAIAPISTNTRFLWDGRIWTLVNLGETTTTLLPEIGEPIQLSSAFFLHLLETHTVILPAEGKPIQESMEIQERMAAASLADLRTVNERFRLVSAYLEQDREQVRQAPVTERTIRRWMRAFQAAQAGFGSGYVGLLPNISRRGNRQPKAPEDSRTLLAAFITDHYETPRESPAWEVYLAYQRACEAKNILPLSARTFYRHIKQRAGYEQTKARQGAKAAYSEKPWHWELAQTTPRHGNEARTILEAIAGPETLTTSTTDASFPDPVHALPLAPAPVDFATLTAFEEYH